MGATEQPLGPGDSGLRQPPLSSAVSVAKLGSTEEQGDPIFIFQKKLEIWILT